MFSDRQSLTVYLEREDYERYRDMAKERGVSMSSLFSELIRDIDREKEKLIADLAGYKRYVDSIENRQAKLRISDLAEQLADLLQEQGFFDRWEKLPTLPILDIDAIIKRNLKEYGKAVNRANTTRVRNIVMDKYRTWKKEKYLLESAGSVVK